MLTDGITLTETGRIENMIMEHGPAFPSENLKYGRAFYLTETVGDYKPGSYVYSEYGWDVMGAMNVVKYDMGLFCQGVVSVGEQIIAGYVAPRNMYFEQNLPGSIARCKVPPKANTVYTINIDDVSCGNITFVPGSVVGIFTFPHSMLAVPGDFVEVISPAVPDTAISDVGITLIVNVEQADGAFGN